MKIAGITKIRNEALIIQDTLDHYAQYCNAGIFIVVEQSEDNTADIAQAHPAVMGVHRILADPDRLTAEWYNRHLAYIWAKSHTPDWIICFDADERLEIDPSVFEIPDIHGIRMRLFDYYITPEDENKPWNERKWIGPEYRSILMAFRTCASHEPCFFMQDQREPHLLSWANIIETGYVHHYGKAISVEEWEKTCDYYSTWPEPYASKWKARKGKAVKHDYKSDFGAPLITWDHKDEKGYLLTH